MHEEDDWGFDDPMLEVHKDTQVLADAAMARIQVRREVSLLQRQPMAVQEVKQSELVASFEVEKQVDEESSPNGVLGDDRFIEDSHGVGQPPFTLGAGDMHEEDDWGFDDPMLEVHKDTQVLADAAMARIQVRREVSLLQRQPMVVQEVKESELVASFEVEKQVLLCYSHSLAFGFNLFGAEGSSDNSSIIRPELLATTLTEHGLPSQQDLINLRKVFDACDENKDGLLTLDELCGWMAKVGLLLTREGLQELICSCDRNLDGRLDFDEFVELSASLQIRFPQSDEAPMSDPRSMDHHDSVGVKENGDSELRDAFLVFDKDGNGVISPVELRSTLSQLGLLAASTSFSRIHSMIRRVDSDGDGEVSFAEFKSMMAGSVNS
ncbi:hypothetical protein L7F22_057838 [Adiantum nelumboides]|nr:hypothetical protein [Adiantum nelumboides]